MSFLEMAKAVTARKQTGKPSAPELSNPPGQLPAAPSPAPDPADVLAKSLRDNAERLRDGQVGDPWLAELVKLWLADTEQEYVAPAEWLRNRKRNSATMLAQ